MLLKDYLKKACELEQSIYERTGKLRKTEAELPKMQERIKKKKEELQNELQKKQSELQSTKQEQIEKANSKPEGLFIPIVISVVALVAIVLFHLLTNYLLVDFFTVESGVGLFFSLLVVNLLPALVVGIVEHFAFDLWFIMDSGWVGSLIAYIITQVASFFYLNSRLNVGEPLTPAIFAAMWVFLGIAIVACIGTCYAINAKQEKKSQDDHWEARRLKKKIPNMETNIVNFKTTIEKYIRDSNHAIARMNQEIQKQKSELETVKRNLTQTYIQANVHPSYREWVKVATLYEYIDTGRRDRLQGKDGAYDLYEQELFNKRILDSLGAINCSINSKGDQILDSQRYLRNAVERSNYLLSQMVVDTYGI